MENPDEFLICKKCDENKQAQAKWNKEKAEL
jgi:hypothetical protein